jgi:hypothetical protein
MPDRQTASGGAAANEVAGGRCAVDLKTIWSHYILLTSRCLSYKKLQILVYKYL